MRGLNEYHPLVNYPFPFRKHGENRRAATAAKRRTAVGLLLRDFRRLSQFTDICTATHVGYSTQGRHNSADQRFYCVYDARQFWVGREQIGERVKVYI